MSQGHGTNQTAAKRGRRLRWLGAIGGFLIIAVSAYVHFFLYLPMGSGPAGPAIESPFDQPWTERQVLLVGLGDSVTAGFGATKGKSFFDRLLKNPPDEFGDMQGRCLSLVLPNLLHFKRPKRRSLISCGP